MSDFSPLGKGGFADVWLARQAHLDRFVAVKVFRVSLADKQAGDQFRAECQAVGRLDRHPHIITVFEANVLPDGRPYLVTEHCDSSLHHLVAARGALPAQQVVDVGLPVAKALLFAHSASVLHGDVTPQNVLLRATGAPVLADFGLAVLRDYQGNVAAGFTMAHAAPETVRYDGAIDRHTDVYGLGSTLYAALTGAPPFPVRPGEEDVARANRILREEPVRPAGPGWLADLLLAMLAKDPALRPDLTAVADALASGGAGLAARSIGAPPARGPAGPPAGPPEGPQWLPPTDSPWAPRSQDHTRNRAGGGGRTGVAEPDGGDLTRERADPQQQVGEKRPARRRWPLVAAAMAALVLVVAAVWALWPAPPAPTPTPTQAPDDRTRIQLAAPVDHGDTVDLRWSADTTLDYGVLVGVQGQQEATARLVGRVDHFTVPVDPGRPYCFRVQGVNAAGTVSESNVVSIRNAVCRFADP